MSSPVSNLDRDRRTRELRKTYGWHPSMGPQDAEIIDLDSYRRSCRDEPEDRETISPIISGRRAWGWARIALILVALYVTVAGAVSGGHGWMVIGAATLFWLAVHFRIFSIEMDRKTVTR